MAEWRCEPTLISSIGRAPVYPSAHTRPECIRGQKTRDTLYNLPGGGAATPTPPLSLTLTQPSHGRPVLCICPGASAALLCPMHS